MRIGKGWQFVVGATLLAFGAVLVLSALPLEVWRAILGLGLICLGGILCKCAHR